MLAVRLHGNRDLRVDEIAFRHKIRP